MGGRARARWTTDDQDDQDDAGGAGDDQEVEDLLADAGVESVGSEG